MDADPTTPVESVTVTGASDSPSTELLAAWLALSLAAPVTRARTTAGTGIVGVRLVREGGSIELLRPDGSVATLTQPGQPDRRIALARRSNSDCLAEELRRLDPDDVFTDVVTRGLPVLGEGTAAVPVERAEREGTSTPQSDATRRAVELDASAAAVAAGIASTELAEPEATPAATDA